MFAAWGKTSWSMHSIVQMNMLLSNTPRRILVQFRGNLLGIVRTFYIGTDVTPVLNSLVHASGNGCAALLDGVAPRMIVGKAQCDV